MIYSQRKGDCEAAESDVESLTTLGHISLAKKRHEKSLVLTPTDNFEAGIIPTSVDRPIRWPLVRI